MLMAEKRSLLVHKENINKEHYIKLGFIDYCLSTPTVECDYDFWLCIRLDDVFFEFFKDHLSMIFDNWTSLSGIAWGTKNDIIFLEIV